MNGFAKISTDRTLRAWLSTDPVLCIPWATMMSSQPTQHMLRFEGEPAVRNALAQRSSGLEFN